MARYGNEFAKLKSEVLRYKKLVMHFLESKIFNLHDSESNPTGIRSTKRYTPKQIQFAKNHLPSLAESIISDLYLLVRRSYYMDAEMYKDESERSEEAKEHWLHNYELPFDIEDAGKYTPAVCLCLALEIDEYDIFDSIDFEHGVAGGKKSAEQKMLEESYQDLLIPAFTLKKIDDFLAYYEDCLKQNVPVECNNDLDLIREMISLLDPMTGKYSVRLTERKEKTSEERKKAVKQRWIRFVKMNDDQKNDLLAVYQGVRDDMVSKGLDVTGLSVSNECFNFVRSLYYIENRKKLMTYFDKFRDSLDGGEYSLELCRQAFLQISREYDKEHCTPIL